MSYPASRLKNEPCYEEKYVNCGRTNCRLCSPGAPGAHGPYWYMRWFERVGKRIVRKTKYLGRNPPRETLSTARAGSRRRARFQKTRIVVLDE